MPYPLCAKLSLPRTARCDCGFDFTTGDLEASSRSRVRGTVDTTRASRRLRAAATVRQLPAARMRD